PPPKWPDLPQPLSQQELPQVPQSSPHLFFLHIPPSRLKRPCRPPPQQSSQQELVAQVLQVLQVSQQSLPFLWPLRRLKRPPRPPLSQQLSQPVLQPVLQSLQQVPQPPAGAAVAAGAAITGAGLAAGA